MKTVNSRHSDFNVVSAFLNICKNYFIVMYLSINVLCIYILMLIYLFELLLFILFKLYFLFIYFNFLYFFRSTRGWGEFETCTAAFCLILQFPK